VQQAPDIPITVRGKIKVKGKGTMRTYWVGASDPTQMAAMMDNDNVSHVDDTTNRAEDDDLGPPPGDSGDSHSQGTHQTHSLSVSTDDDDAFYASPPSPTPAKQESDHIIKVHTSGSDHHQARVSMDGAIGNSSSNDVTADEEM
jgi:hypothetical protein